jgi:hypothetical protein
LLNFLLIQNPGINRKNHHGRRYHRDGYVNPKPGLFRRPKLVILYFPHTGLYHLATLTPAVALVTDHQNQRTAAGSLEESRHFVGTLEAWEECSPKAGSR